MNARAASASAPHSASMRRAPCSFGSVVIGVLHRSIVLAAALAAASPEHHVSHQSHSVGREKIGTWCCA